VRRIYLVGPITGCTLDECADWRKKVRRDLSPHEFEVLSPLRADAFLANVSTPEIPDAPGMSGRNAFNRDVFDVRSCDILFANLLYAKRVSIGSVMEVMHGWGIGKYVVVIMEKGGIHDHLFVREAASIVFRDVPSATRYVIEAFGNER
jgi:hypothetical protein